MDIGTALAYFLYSKTITSFNALDRAFTELNEAIDVEKYGAENTIRGLLGQEEPYLFETVLVSRGMGEEIRRFLIRHPPSPGFPTASPQAYIDVLKSFRTTFQGLRSALDTPMQIHQLGDLAENLSQALLATIVFSARQRKKATVSNARSISKVNDLDLETTLGKVNCAPPDCLEGADKTADLLARRLANIMKTYLDFLFTPSSVRIIRSTFMKTLSSNEEGSVFLGLSKSSTSTFVPLPDDVLVHLRDRVEEGKWLIVLARRALRHLKQLSAKHPTVYNVAISKLEELSSGLFTRFNHARFLGNKFSIPLFAAELVDDISIIYHIDCGAPSTSGSQGRQFIRVFDIDDPQKPLWRLVATQLQGRPAVYRRRCTARATPQHAPSGGYIVTPLAFDRGVDDDEESAEQTEYVSTENERKLLELHRVLALEKFIPYSRDLIDAVEQDRDGTFIFSVSPTERDIIEHRSSCLVLGRSGTGKTTTMMFKMLLYEKAVRPSELGFRQVFVTQSPMLAEKVKEYYRKLENRSLDLGADQQDGDSSTIESLTFAGMNRGMRQNHGALPESWKELQDHDFPLFLSYDELCNLLAADLGLDFDPEILDETAYRGSKRSAGIRTGRITFRYFFSRIWPSLGAYGSGIDPLLLFNEIIGVIKGSETALATDSGYLDRSTYEQLSSRVYPMFADRRGLVYDLFLRYLRYRPKGAWDVADRSHELITAMRKNRLPHTIDFIYVDEAQDNLLADTALLRALCPNPHGLFFAGDTAQTVSAGNTFRFNDLKAFLYRLERQDHLVVNRKRKAIDPHFFTLSINYRSHAGIIEPAAFIIICLTRFFPGSVDIMAREQALVRGPKPVFFSDRGTQTPFDAFISGHGSSDMEFGADQVIIVRDEASRDKLRQKIGRHAGMVMTLYASKGQEFNDVLLYDFFTDSPATQSNWRALFRAYSSMQGGEVQPLEVCDAILQSELKCLYVGLTRAREHVWFWDSTDKGDAFESVLVQEGLARAASADEFPQSMGVKSSTREWALRGKECFQREDYFNASLSFERADLTWWKGVADAFEQKRIAESLPIQDPSRRDLLRRSAEEISSCAVRAPTTKDREHLTAVAATCFIEARDHKSAGRLLYELRRYDEATWNFRLGAAFKKAVFVILQHETEMDTELVQDVKYVCALVFVRRGENELAKSLFPTLEEYAEFLEENHFHGYYAATLLELSRYEEAAEVFLRLGRQTEAVRCFLESGSNELRLKASTCLINSLFVYISLKKAKDPEKELTAELSNQASKEPAVEDSKELRSLVDLGSRVELSSEQRAELLAAKAIHSMDPNQLRSCAYQHAASYPHIALLSLDKLLSKPTEHLLGKGSASISRVISLLRDCVLYGRLVRATTQNSNLVQSSNFQRIFGLSQPDPSSLNEALDGIVVRRHSFVYSRDLARKVGIRTEEGAIFPAAIVAQHVQKGLILKHTLLLEELAKTLDGRKYQSPFNICLYQVRQGRCSLKTCDKYHPAAEDLSIQGFNRRVELHLLVIAALEGLTGVTRRRVQRIWLQRLFGACYPPENRLGGLSWLRTSLIPEYDSLLSAAKIWCEDLYRTMGRDRTFFLANAIGCALFGSTLDYRNATKYIPSGEWQRASQKSESQRHLEAALGWFSCSNVNRHAFGIAFIQHAVLDELQMDILTLISFAEEVIGHLIYNYFLLSKNQDREVLLPRSWALRACQQGVSPMNLGPGSYRTVEALSHLLSILLRKDEPGEGGRNDETGEKAEANTTTPLKLHYRGEAIERVSRSVKVSATGKVCRMLALVGQNFGDAPLISNIIEAFGKLKQDEPTPHYTYQSFAEATTWEEVLKALTEFAQRTPSDPLLTIAEKLPLRNRTRPAGTRPLRCISAEGLSTQLGLVETGLPPMPVKQAPDSGRGTVGNVDISTTRAAAEHTNPSSTDWSAKIEAARQIVYYWQRYRRRCESKLGGPLWKAYCQRANRLSSGNQESRLYKIYLRLFGPKVLAYVRRMIDQCNDVKNGLIKEQASAHHAQLDEFRRRIRVFRNLYGDIKVIEASIAPDTPLHSRCSLHSLEDEVQKVVALRKKAIGLHPNFKTLDVDYNNGVESLLTELRLRRTKPLRPTLNTDDLDSGPA